MQKNYYHTAGRDALIAFLQKNPDRQFTVEELYAQLSERVSVGKSSLYRHLSELCEAEIVRKFHSKERDSNLYQYVGDECDCKHHFHQKCTVCGRINHLDCHASADFAEHLMREHGFAVDCGQSVLYGVCAECNKKGGRQNA